MNHIRLRRLRFHNPNQKRNGSEYPAEQLYLTAGHNFRFVRQHRLAGNITGKTA